MRPSLGVCYYPEHWPETSWRDDARRMAEAGIGYVRIGEFAWSRLEPAPGAFDAGWLLRAMDMLQDAGPKVVLGTPTATPPRWVVDRMPDMLIVDAEGRRRGFGSRRHYDFSHAGYRAEAARITRTLAEAVGDHPALCLWQTDNEYGCHDSTLSYSPAALEAFREWLAQKYGDIAALNEAWATVFWSMRYDGFGQVGLPNLTQAEPAPAHRLDFRRFASDQVLAFNRAQVEVLRQVTPDVPVTHNYMGEHTSFDHYALGEQMAVASWDSYPLGRLVEREGVGERAAVYARQGDPDVQAFHANLYRRVGNGRVWIMEQQAGPVNWAAWNADPLPGMVRLWTWEAIAHGTEVVSYFRWRQAPFAQEQMHAGLLRPDGEPAPGLAEAAQVAREIGEVAPEVQAEQAEVAVVFDYESCWAWEVQPHSRGFSHLEAVFAQYRALRRLGLNVDVIAPGDPWDGYRAVFAPALFRWPDGFEDRLARFDGTCLLGPRSGSRDAAFRIPDGLPPGLSANLLDVKVVRVAGLSPAAHEPLRGGGEARLWLEAFETGAEIVIETEGGQPVLCRQGGINYLGAWLDEAGTARVVRSICDQAGIETAEMPPGVRLRRCGSRVYVFNYGRETRDLRDLGIRGRFRLDAPVLPPAGVGLVET